MTPPSSRRCARELVHAQEVLPAPVIDVELARRQMRNAIVDNAIAGYRRTRIDDMLTAV
jgi:hypothetical protein